MTDERAKEIAEEIRTKMGHNEPINEFGRKEAAFLLHLYDEIQSLKAAAAATSFLHAGIQPVRRTDG